MCERADLWCQSRVDDVMKSSGYRIGPGEIEATQMTHPSVALCAMVGEPDELRCQVPVAHMVLRRGHDPGEELVADLQQLVRTRLTARQSSVVSLPADLGGPGFAH